MYEQSLANFKPIKIVIRTIINNRIIRWLCSHLCTHEPLKQSHEKECTKLGTHTDCGFLISPTTKMLKQNKKITFLSNFIAYYNKTYWIEIIKHKLKYLPLIEIEIFVHFRECWFSRTSEYGICYLHSFAIYFSNFDINQIFHFFFCELYWDQMQFWGYS